MRRFSTAVLLLAALSRADDGATAPPNRWSHARGPASNCAESFAEPPETFGRIAWTYKPKGAVRFTPVVWDGAVFVVEGDAKRSELVALDAETGAAWARVAVRAPGQPAVYARSAFLVEEGGTVSQIRLDGRTLTREWSFVAGAGASPPRVIDGEVIVTTPGALLSLRPGLSQPAWKVAGNFTGEPAVRDGHVYALRRDGPKLLLSAYARADGKEASPVVLNETAPAATGGRIVIGNRVAAILVPPEADRTWAILERKPGTPDLTLARTEKLLTDPLAGDYSLLALAAEPRAWTILYTDPKRPRIERVAVTARPELFESVAPCIWLGESCQVYGDWCGDVISNVIFWHARERPEGAPLRKGLLCNAVPARDRLLLFVPADGKSVLALAPEEIR